MTSSTFLNIKDKNDTYWEFRNSNFLKEHNICRLCFQLHQKSLQAIENPEKKLINMCLPYHHQLDLNLVKDPVICLKCLNICKEFADLLITFMNTEKKLQSYCSTVQNNIPIKIDEFVENVLISDPDFSIVIKEEEEPEAVLNELSINKLDLLLDTGLTDQNHNEKEEKNNKFDQINNLESPHQVESTACKEKFNSKKTLYNKTEIIIISPTKTKFERNFVCDICGKLFCRKYSLDKHRMNHTGDKPFKCDQCEMRFKTRYCLTLHMRSHTGEKPFECDRCGFKFSWKNLLILHMRKHTGARPYSCQFCKMAFSRNDHLIKHTRAIHTGERPFQCEICSKTFNRKDYLHKHKKVHLKHTEIIK